jgi:hypothetical protein
MNRRSIIMMLIGAIATLTGLAVTALLRQRRCEGAGGRWSVASRECLTATGEQVDVAATMDGVIGLLAALVLGFMLFRVLLFVMGRMTRRTP